MIASRSTATLRTHLSDAAFHARAMQRSLEHAAQLAHTRHSERNLARLARTAQHWAARLEPATKSKP